MTRLSVNINKVALLRNSRNNGIPSVIHAAEQCIAAGAHGITVHPRPDQRHIRTLDVYELAEILKRYPRIEFNIEGNPYPDFMELVGKVRPAQCTLVPDDPSAFTSDHGWDLRVDAMRLGPIVAKLKESGARVSLFMDADSDQWMTAKSVGADRVELYTEPYADAFGQPEFDSVFARYARAAEAAQNAGLGVNAGHDLNLANLGAFCKIPGILEVSIGHALIADALDMGIANAVRAYLRTLDSAPHQVTE
ncbi:MAG TPA: pyridoxine 5'-phosphate synthase [Terriglobia bacterium]|nr:pyridoxine 5'-phosphate synthase [Terriglobia bacterium]